MADGIAKGIGEQLGQIGKAIATDIAKVPSQIIGLDKSGGTNETSGQGTGGKKQQQKPNPQNIQRAAGDPNRLAELEQQDAIERQKQMSKARDMLRQFTQPTQQSEPSVYERLQQEKMQEEQAKMEKAKSEQSNSLPMPSSKPKRGNLHGIKSKQFGGELGKNVKSQ